MAVKTKKYRALHTTKIAIRNDEVRAIRVTDRNAENVAAWLGERGEFASNRKLYQTEVTNRRVRVKTPDGWRVAKVGDFVVVGTKLNLKTNKLEKKFFVGKDDVFEAGFELVK